MREYIHKWEYLKNTLNVEIESTMVALLCQKIIIAKVMA
jgi:uridine phosphorylase